MQVLAHKGWIQSATNWGQHAGLPLEQFGIAAPDLRGTLYLERGDLLHFGAQLQLGTAPVYTLSELRKVRFNEKHLPRPPGLRRGGDGEPHPRGPLNGSLRHHRHRQRPRRRRRGHELAKNHRRVAMVEKSPDVGGGCTHWGTIPSKALRQAVKTVDDLSATRCSSGIQLTRTLGFPELLGTADGVINAQVAHPPALLRAQPRADHRGAARFVDPHTIEVERRRREAAPG